MSDSNKLNLKYNRSFLCEEILRDLSTAVFLKAMLKSIWKHKHVPRASFIRIFKSKGSVNPIKCIGLLAHAYKILSLIMIGRIMEEYSE